MLDWWADAGVDYVFREEPREWLAPPPAAEPIAQPEQRTAAARAPAPAPAAPISQDRADWPSDLATFAGWWLAEPWLDAGRKQGRVPPRGTAGARLMVLVPQPESDDGETLLSGAQGRLIAAMLAAIGIAPAEAYIASAIPRHTPAADWNEIHARGLNEVLLHHVALVGPERVIAFGDTVLSLLGNDPPNITAPLCINPVGSDPIPLLALRSLEGLLARPGWKADAWRKWLAWTR